MPPASLALFSAAAIVAVVVSFDSFSARWGHIMRLCYSSNELFVFLRVDTVGISFFRCCGRERLARDFVVEINAKACPMERADVINRSNWQLNFRSPDLRHASHAKRQRYYYTKLLYFGKFFIFLQKWTWRSIAACAAQSANLILLETENLSRKRSNKLFLFYFSFCFFG